MKPKTIRPERGAARSLERIGDRCENSAEYIFYLVKGRDIRHLSKEGELAKASEQKN